ncbi:MAG: hypothetical protein ACRD16_13445 [Thermoanaerobaculia bacterium]
MTETPKLSGLDRASIALTAAGVFVCLALLIRETPYTLTAFMFVGQPLIALGLALFAIRVIRDLRRKELL